LVAADLEGRSLLASGGDDGTVRPWDPISGAPFGEPLTGHTGSVLALAAVDLEGRSLLASGSADGMAVLWRSGEGATAEYVPDVEARVISDRAAEADLLEHEPLANAITAAIRHPTTRAPVTIAVKGPWGSGKSTVMNLVRNRLDPPSEDGRRRELPFPGPPGRWRSTPAALWLGEAFRLAGRPATTPRRDDSTRNVEAELAVLPDEVDRVTVWFNPWFYETGEQVWSGLAHEVISQVSERFTRIGRERFWLRLNLKRVDQHAVRRALYTQVADRLVKYIAMFAVAAVALAIRYTPAFGAAVFSITVSGALIGTTVRAWFTPAATALEGLLRGPVHDTVETVNAAVPALGSLIPDPGYEARTGYMHLIRTDLQRVIDVVAPDPTRPIVVFIDDLDRCNPNTVMQTLEAINLFLAGELKNCIFVLGIEPTMLASHIETTHSELLKTLRKREPLLETEDLSWRFLEKLLQLSVRLPEPSDDVVASYMGALLQAPDAVPTDAPKNDPATPPLPSAGPNAGSVNASIGGFAKVPRPESEAAPDAPMTDPQRLSEKSVRSEPIAPNVARQAERVRSRAAVATKLRLDDARVIRIVAEAVDEVDGNPRVLKRLVNLFVFTSYVAAERALLSVSSEDAILADLRKVSHACILLVRWPHLVERLAKRPKEVGDTSAGRTVLEVLASAPATEDWDELTTRFGLTKKPESQDVRPALLDLQQFIRSHRDSIALVARLI
jgi:hypothetical protein